MTMIYLIQNLCNSHRFYVIILMWFASAFSVRAQNIKVDKASFCCLYTHYVKTETKEHVAAVDSFYSILEVGESVCKYGDLSAYVWQKKKIPATMQALTKENCSRDEYLWVLQNYPKEGVMTVEEALHPSFFTYEESADALRWTLLSGDSTVMNYTCHPAHLSYAGREWRVWYTEEIPVSAGPWKFTGLPGFVLFAQDKTGTHTFRAYSIFNVNGQGITRANTEYKDKKTKRDQFIKTRNRIKADPQWMRTPWYNDRNNVKMGILSKKSRDEFGIPPFISVNGIKYPCREREDGQLELIHNYYQPLELY